MGFFLRGILAAGAILVAFYAYNPLPSEVGDPIVYSVLVTKLRLIEDVSKAVEFLGICDMRISRRNLFENYLTRPRPRPEGMQITDTFFGGIKVRVFRTTSGGTKLRKGLVYIHGGGYVLGSVNICHNVLTKIAEDTGAVIVAVEYRLAPEHPSPAPLEDCYAASSYFFSHAAEWGVDPKNIGIAGLSAGGNMAAVLSLKYRDEGGDPQFAYQILIHPWMQAMDFKLPSYQEKSVYMAPDMKQKGMVIYTITFLGVDVKHIPKFQNNQHVTKETRLKYSKFFNVESLPGYKPTEESEPEVDKDLAREVETRITNPYNFPLMAESLSNVPPAFVLTMGIDTIRDDGLLYAQRLRDEGVEIEHYHDEQSWHASILIGVGGKPFLGGKKQIDAIVKYINS